MKKMLTDKEAEYMDGHFRSFLQLLCEYFGMSEKDALREIELRVNLTRTKLLQKPKVRTLHPAYIDFNDKASSLLIEFGSTGEETLESNAHVLVSFSKCGLTGVEILFDDKEVVKKVSEAFIRQD
ncbi:MAG: hypothetical protein J7J01_00030 [Methanophagales archaeon]|nr:hypothetical protein [Methanophagales archaeon]